MTLITIELASQSHHKDDIKTCKAFRRVPAHPKSAYTLCYCLKKKKKNNRTSNYSYDVQTKLKSEH